MNGAADDNDWMNQSPIKGGELPELSEDDTDVALSVILHNSEDPVTTTSTDVDTHSFWTPDDLSNLETTERLQFCSNGSVSPDGITSQQNCSQTSETCIGCRGASDVMVDSLNSATTLRNNSHFIPNPGVEVPNGTTLGNGSISNGPEMVRFNGHGEVEPPTAMENGTLRVQDLTNADVVGQTSTQSAIGIQQPQRAHNVSQKRLPGINKDEDPRCTCPKSRCLKDYCQCFGRKKFCGNSCSCVNCQNNKDYEDTVELEREKKRLQNPNTCSRETNDTPNETIRKIRKRGCNCRNSKCAKNYCQCYQAGVGCFEGCRCEGCENRYNRKPDQNKTPNSNDNEPSSSGVGCQQNVS